MTADAVAALVTDIARLTGVTEQTVRARYGLSDTPGGSPIDAVLAELDRHDLHGHWECKCGAAHLYDGDPYVRMQKWTLHVIDSIRRAAEGRQAHETAPGARDDDGERHGDPDRPRGRETGSSDVRPFHSTHPHAMDGECLHGYDERTYSSDVEEGA